jgi:L-cysteine:1D-myo-inositol 2-amino-2-deoxy-alpha-D-glucopyranoside ligase
MSKSLGNLVFVSDLCKDWEPMVVRLALLGHHYREDWTFSYDDLPRAAARLERWRTAPAAAGEVALTATRERLDDDLDTPGALAAIDAEADAGRPIGAAASLLGVTL